MMVEKRMDLKNQPEDFYSESIRQFENYVGHKSIYGELHQASLKNGNISKRRYSMPIYST